MLSWYAPKIPHEQAGFNLERNEIDAKKRELSAKLAELKESQKTPEDRIKEMEAELASLNTEDFQ